MKRYVFRYRKERTRTGEIVWRPVLYLHLKSCDKNFYLFDAYIDSGADISLFTKSDCELLGYNLDEGKERFIGGISGTLIRTYEHKVQVKLGEVEFGAKIAFAELDEVPRLLGRKSFLKKFKILFDEENKVVYFKVMEFQ